MQPGLICHFRLTSGPGTHRFVGRLLGVILWIGLAEIRNFRINHTEPTKKEAEALDRSVGLQTNPATGCGRRKLRCFLVNPNFPSFGFLVLISIAETTYSPIFCRSPPRPVYSVRQPLNTEAYLWVGLKARAGFSLQKSCRAFNHALLLLGAPPYPLVSRIMSPGWIRLPTSSHTEMLMLPVLSATLQVRTSCPSFVLVTRPLREEIYETGNKVIQVVVIVRVWVLAE